MIHKTAIIDPEAKISSSAEIGAYYNNWSKSRNR